MISKIKNKTILIIEAIHLKIFGHAMGSEMKTFLFNLGITTLSTVFSGFAMLLVNILAGRVLGPEIYGRYQLAYSVANIMLVFMLMGVHVSVARSNFPKIENKSEIIGTSFWFVTLNVIVVSSLVYLFRNFLLEFKISEKVLIFSIIFSIGLTFYNLVKAYFQAEHKFKFIARSEIINYCIVLFLFFLFLFINKKDFEYVIYALTAGSMVYALIGIFKFRKYLISFNYKILKEIMSYGFLAFIVITSGLIISSFNRLLLNNFLGEKNLGIYSAYFLSSTIFIMFLVKVISVVLFPTIAKIENKKYLPEIVRKISKFEKVFMFPLFILNLFMIILFIKLFGSKFEFNFYYFLFVSAASTFSLFTSLRQWFLVALGKEGLLMSLKIVLAVAILSILYYIILVKGFGLLGAFMALFLMNITFYILTKIFIEKKYVLT